jgi:hypothetical protein
METTRLRPHNLLCERFLKLEFPERGAEFQKIKQSIKKQLASQATIEVVEGVDELCRSCPHCYADRCEHPQGNEEAARKWDSIILEGLGISYGEKRTSEQWHTLIQEKAPLEFCQSSCPWSLNCTVTKLAIGT